MLDKNMKRVRCTLVMDVEHNGTLPQASVTLEGPQIVVYAAMSAAIVQWSIMHKLPPHAVHYCATWEDM